MKEFKIKAKKSLGQNFLTNEEILENIGNILEIKGKKIVEVGPGYGALTEIILGKKPNKLELVELDDKMIDILDTRIDEGSLDISDIDFNLNHMDILDYNPDFSDYSIIANIPYYITSPILRHFLYEVDKKPENMVILMQKDVGDKILGGKKNKSSVISLFVKKKCIVSEEIIVAKENFTPSPKVESSVLLFKNHDNFKEIDDKLFMKFIKIGFAEPRKKLSKNLIKGGYERELVLSSLIGLGFDENIRGDDLTIEKWCELFKILK